MQLRNYTPFSALAFRHYHQDGTLMAVVSVRGTFHIYPGSPLIPAPVAQQSPLQLADLYAGDDPASSELITPSDLAPFKPGCDITVRANAHTHGDYLSPHWECGVQIGDIGKTIRVCGPRFWRPRWIEERAGIFSKETIQRFDGWQISEPRPAGMVRLGWKQAFGGPLPGQSADAPTDVYAENPLGMGLIDPTSPPKRVRRGQSQDIPAPFLENLDLPIADPAALYPPAGLGPVPPVWPGRLQYAGTYDDAWLAERHPLLPDDFNYRFYQCAAPGLISEEYMHGDEPIILSGLHPVYPRIETHIPKLDLSALVRWKSGSMSYLPLNLDGVHIDMTLDPATVFLTWRCWTALGDGIRVIDLDADRREQFFALSQESINRRPVYGDDETSLHTPADKEV